MGEERSQRGRRVSGGEAVGRAWQDQGWPAGMMETRYKAGVGGDTEGRETVRAAVLR